MNHQTRTFLVTAGLVAVLGLPFGTANAADGINRLIMVTQLKTQNANDEALDGAERQRELAQKQKQLRERQKSLESHDRLGNFEIQRLMSQQHQGKKTLSGALKKRDETTSAVIRNQR